ncbi:MAG: hypothetical protein KDG44_15375 [Burkholderiaceae bacterium]|nr:hypothetical protein [Burkholderiaceae bacterium]
MQLQPRRERGRCDRKAAAYAAEIIRLRREGYTFEAIREALIDIGVELSEATLRREVRRRQQPADPSGSTVPPASLVSVRTTTAPSMMPATAPTTRTGTSGREIAEAFFNANPSNPLLRTKGHP